MEADFKDKLFVYDAARNLVTNMLWRAQLIEYPDSMQVLDAVAAREWPVTPINGAAYGEAWGRAHSQFHYESQRERNEARREHIAQMQRDFEQQTMRAIITCLSQYPGVFYVCGKRANGTYAHRGFRYGARGSEYMSGFPDPDPFHHNT